MFVHFKTFHGDEWDGKQRILKRNIDAFEYIPIIYALYNTDGEMKGLGKCIHPSTECKVDFYSIAFS